MNSLKELINLRPDHSHAHFLLAAQYAQIGMMDRAEESFRVALKFSSPDFPMPRFQLGKLLLMKGESSETVQVLAPLTRQEDEIGAYARALTAIAEEDRSTAIAALREGLAMPQSVPPLHGDMQRLLAELERAESEPAGVDSAASSMLLSNYGRH